MACYNESYLADFGCGFSQPRIYDEMNSDADIRAVYDKAKETPKGPAEVAVAPIKKNTITFTVTYEMLFIILFITLLFMNSMLYWKISRIERVTMIDKVLVADGKMLPPLPSAPIM